MKVYSLRIPPEIEAFIRILHPGLKLKIRRALDEISINPHIGKTLKEELSGLYSYRVSQYRIVYKIKREEILVEVVEVAERRIVYQRVAELLKKIH